MRENDAGLILNVILPIAREDRLRHELPGDWTDIFFWRFEQTIPKLSLANSKIPHNRDRSTDYGNKAGDPQWHLHREDRERKKNVLAAVRCRRLHTHLRRGL